MECMRIIQDKNYEESARFVRKFDVRPARGAAWTFSYCLRRRRRLIIILSATHTTPHHSYRCKRPRISNWLLSVYRRGPSAG